MLQRPRRNRLTPTLRNLVQENHLQISSLIQPLFLVPGVNIKLEIKSLPGIFRFSEDLLLEEIGACMAVGVQTFLIFPAIPEELKDKGATYSYSKDNFYLKAARNIKKKFPSSCIISDVAMDPYSIDGHDGWVEDGQILNDKTLPVLAKMAAAQAEAGFDMIGPSDMMDGRIKYIREYLDNEGYTNTGIMSYTAKYASAFYGPFRDALDSAPKSGDKKTYQMNPANLQEALKEAHLDISEGADVIMVKPALHYLDVIHLLKTNTNIPIAAYHVSGECAMLIAAAQNGWLDRQKAIEETLMGIKRAGADIIITYFAREYAERVALMK
ncbi:MAG: porphobilinogen synthase [Saprospiraceae bacterium]|nr:porphobilinogen synthase [Saprospiraceae bacterium]MDP4814351.1 porphobilinogen synthase [Saprospiraceae bacterium]MDP4912849.1 porphobilinogen synthase [Saprospiraceae bacterium]MDP5047858.1 porphobilinogen synthase [Saprospiraceae bacterium]MDP5090282.1 porphobilinogen synthase [Saprospiraceae bacterium]